MDPKKYGVHASHCCIIHGCKYGDEDCPVVAGLVEGIEGKWCEDCVEDMAEYSEFIITLKDRSTLSFGSFVDVIAVLHEKRVLSDNPVERIEAVSVTRIFPRRRY